MEPRDEKNTDGEMEKEYLFNAFYVALRRNKSKASNKTNVTFSWGLL
jgi:hypothetical protein